MSHEFDQFSLGNRTWDLGRTGFWIGGHFPAPNLSKGYHGILKQWWDAYMSGKRVLLISESGKVKKVFQEQYPNWEFETLDYYPELAQGTQEDCDIFVDICVTPFPEIGRKFDLIINQATLEHLYSPFDAMKNMVGMLSEGGILVSHTHPPGGSYHSWPRDYFRFMKDWWYDLPKYIKNIELLEMLMVDNLHVYSCYRKTGN